MATVAAALLDASRRLSENPDLFKDASSTGNMSMGSSSSFSSGNEVCRTVRMFSRNNHIFYSRRAPQHLQTQRHHG